jgi:hypothetical protein
MDDEVQALHLRRAVGHAVPGDRCPRRGRAGTLKMRRSQRSTSRAALTNWRSSSGPDTGTNSTSPPTTAIPCPGCAGGCDARFPAVPSVPLGRRRRPCRMPSGRPPAAKNSFACSASFRRARARRDKSGSATNPSARRPTAELERAARPRLRVLTAPTPVEDRVNRPAGAQLHRDALGVQQRELLDAALEVLELAQVGVA